MRHATLRHTCDLQNLQPILIPYGAEAQPAPLLSTLLACRIRVVSTLLWAAAARSELYPSDGRAYNSRNHASHFESALPLFQVVCCPWVSELFPAGSRTEQRPGRGRTPATGPSHGTLRTCRPSRWIPGTQSCGANRLFCTFGRARR